MLMCPADRKALVFSEYRWLSGTVWLLSYSFSVAQVHTWLLRVCHWLYTWWIQVPCSTWGLSSSLLWVNHASDTPIIWCSHRTCIFMSFSLSESGLMDFPLKGCWISACKAAPERIPRSFILITIPHVLYKWENLSNFNVAAMEISQWDFLSARWPLFKIVIRHQQTVSRPRSGGYISSRCLSLRCQFFLSD